MSHPIPFVASFINSIQSCQTNAALDALREEWKSKGSFRLLTKADQQAVINAGVARRTAIATTAAHAVVDTAIAAVSVGPSTGLGIYVVNAYAIKKHLTRRADLVAALNAAGFQDLAPKVPSAKRHLGEAMRLLNYHTANNLMARCVVDNQLVTTDSGKQVRHTRWVVGYVHASSTSDSLGTKTLTVDLHGDRLTYSGDDSIMATVREAFNERTAGVTYDAPTLLTWFSRILTRDYKSVSVGFAHYVAPSQVLGVCKLVSALTKEVMGREISTLSPASKDDVRKHLPSGLAAIYDDLAETVEIGKVSPVTLLSKIVDFKARVNDVAAIAGQDAIGDLAKQCAALEITVRGRMTDLDQRAGMLEMS